MSEKNLSRRIKNILWDAGAHVQRIEDKFNCGIPDLNYGIDNINGWIELKFLQRWPVKKTTKINIKHFTEAQRHWLVQRGQRAGYCFLLLQVGKENFLLFTWDKLPPLEPLIRKDFENLDYEHFTDDEVKEGLLLRSLRPLKF